MKTTKITFSTKPNGAPKSFDALETTVEVPANPADLAEWGWDVPKAVYGGQSARVKVQTEMRSHWKSHGLNDTKARTEFAQACFRNGGQHPSRGKVAPQVVELSKKLFGKNLDAVQEDLESQGVVVKVVD